MNYIEQIHKFRNQNSLSKLINAYLNQGIIDEEIHVDYQDDLIIKDIIDYMIANNFLGAGNLDLAMVFKNSIIKDKKDSTKDRKVIFLGPWYMPICALRRSAGYVNEDGSKPPPHIIYTQYKDNVPRTKVEWDARVNKIAEDTKAIPLDEIFPLIVMIGQKGGISFGDDYIFGISDGNHRYKAFKKNDIKYCWAVVVFKTN
jgi:hypothetical protein